LVNNNSESNLLEFGGTGKLVSGLVTSEAEKPVVTIITINFNGAKTLADTLKSVIGQDYPFIEYIVLDGGSTDSSLEIIKNYEQNISYWQSGKDKGISDAFNKGIQKATGEFIGIINSDDWYEERAVSSMIANANNADVLYGDMRYWKEGKPDYVFKATHTLLHQEMTINHPTTFVRRLFYTEKVGLFNVGYKYAMDYELMLRLQKAGARFVYIPAVLANMRLDGASDARWLDAYKEVKQAKIDNGIPRKVANRYFYQQVTRTFLSKTFRKIGLEGLVSWYRKHFSMIKKDKA